MIARAAFETRHIAPRYTEHLNSAHGSRVAKFGIEGRLMLYAAYGSNLHPLRLTERTSSAQLLGTACLPNWSLCFHKRGDDGSGKCSILAGDGGVHFAIFDIDAEDKVTLDKIEGLGKGYSEIVLNIPGFGSCVSYVAEDSYIDDSLRPYDWYQQLVLAGATFHGFSDHYLKNLENIQARRDPDSERSDDQWELVERVRRSPVADPLELKAKN